MIVRTGDPTAVRVACAQLAARDVEDHERALGEALDAIAEAGRVGADLVLLPECTYPAYILAVDAPPAGLRSDEDVVSVLAQAARTHDVFIAAGLARGWRPGKRVGLNHAVLVGPDGSIQLEAGKHLLWDFDRCWFRAGRPSGTTSVRLRSEAAAVVGMLICADLRMPEVARMLAVEGAQLLLDPTAWVTGGDPAVLLNPQPEYLMSVRALENGVWIAAADKVGMERGTVVYAGRSMIVAPDGSVVAMASASEPEVVWADIDLGSAIGPPVPRRPDLYLPLVDDDAAPDVTDRRARPLIPRQTGVRVGLLQSGVDDALPAVRASITGRLPMIEALGISLLAFAASGSEQDVAMLGALVAEKTGVATVVATVDPTGEVGRLDVIHGSAHLEARATHAVAGRTSASLEYRTLDIGDLRLATMVGWEGLTPEVARVLALADVDLVVWASSALTPLALLVARARAMENRMWVALVQPTGEHAVDAGATSRVALINPDGRPVALGFPGRDHLVAGMVHTFASRAKQVTPGTDVLADREPAAYATLVAEAGRST